MESNKDWANIVRGWLDKAGSVIPMYNAYREREFRRQDDKIFREMLVDKIDEIKDSILKIMKNPKDLDTLKVIDPLYKKLQSIQDRIRYASYGYGGFFDRDKVDIEQLDELVNYDKSLDEYVSALQELSKNLQSTQNDNSQSIQSFELKLKELEDAVEKRKHLLEDNK
jgi:hypothetical protein